MVLEVCWDGLWTLSFGLSQFHGDGSWLMCEVTLGTGDSVLEIVISGSMLFYKSKSMYTHIYIAHSYMTFSMPFYKVII